MAHQRQYCNVIPSILTNAQTAPSRQSQYRRRLATLARPLDPQVENRLELMRRLFSVLHDPKGSSSDHQRSVHMVTALLQHAREKGVDIPIHDNRAMLRGVFLEQGVVATLIGEQAIVGPLLWHHTFIDLLCSITAVERGEAFSSYTPNLIIAPPKVIVDLTPILEEAVEWINFIRFNQPEQIAALCINHGETPTPDLIKTRLSMFTVEGNDEKTVRKALAEIGDIDVLDERALKILFARFRIIRLMADVVRATYDEDEIQHTMNLCNVIARSTIIGQLAIHREFERLRFTNEINTIHSILDAFSRCSDLCYLLFRLAKMAYGNICLELARMEREALEAETPKVRMFRINAAESMVNFLRITPSGTILESLVKTLLPKNDLQSAAKKTFDHCVERETGMGFTEWHPDFVHATTRINKIDVVDADTLAIIAGIWKRDGYAGVEQ